MIIGLTGKNASGKGEVANFLKTRNFEYLSLSDVIRDELTKQNTPSSRENMIQKGNELREKFGSSVLADRLLTSFEVDKNYVIDSIRNPSEVDSLRRRRDFTLIEVTAKSPIRFERILKRQREGDPDTYEYFLKLDQAEENGSPHHQKLVETARLSDLALENNLTLKDLQNKVLEIVQKLSLGSYRPSWDEYFMNIAKTVAIRSSCIKRKVAAVIVKDKRIISTGYNGTPRGVTNCNEGGCPRCNSMTPSGQGLMECICSHAEENSITQAAYHGVSITKSVLYTTYSPCLICAKMIINSGIQEVVYNQHYTIGQGSLELLRASGINVRSMEMGSVSDKEKGRESKKVKREVKVNE